MLDINEKYEQYILKLYNCNYLKILLSFLGYTDSDIDEFVCVKKNKLPLPADCPDGFKKLIDKCREFESLDRPTAGGKLQT